MTSKKNITLLREIAGDDELLNEIIEQSIAAGVIDNNGKELANIKPLRVFSKRYGKYLLNHEKIVAETISFKVDGRVNLENVKLDTLRGIDSVITIIADTNYSKQKLAGLKMNREDYEGNIGISLKTGSFEVELTLPSVEQHSLGSDIDTLTSSIAADGDINDNSQTDSIADAIEKLLSFPEVDYVQMSKGGSDELKKSPKIIKSHVQKIKSYREKKQMKFEPIFIEEPIFNEKVIIFATDSKSRTFKGYAKEHKVFSFNCTEPKDQLSWWNAINNQIESVEDMEKAKIVTVTGQYTGKNSIKVDSVTVDTKK